MINVNLEADMLATTEVKTASGRDQVGRPSAVSAPREHPELARRVGIEGRVYVQFIVNENGESTSPQVVRGIGGGCDEEAVRAIMQPRPLRAGYAGKPVRVRMSIPINFQLRKADR